MARKPIYTKRLGIDVAKEAKGSTGRYHVIPAHVDRWSVVAEGNVKPVKAFASKRDAVVYAKGIAGEIIVHGTDGKIISRITY